MESSVFDGEEKAPVKSKPEELKRVLAPFVMLVSCCFYGFGPGRAGEGKRNDLDLT